jgi:hypothetical protein
MTITIGTRVCNVHDNTLLGTVTTDPATHIDRTRLAHRTVRVQWDEPITVNGRVTTETVEGVRRLRAI